MKKSSLVVASLVFTSTFFLVLTILPENVSAGTLYVGGSGPGNYTSIQRAIDDANPGDTVFVYSGVYYERITISKTLSLIGEKRGVLIWGSEEGDVIHVSADWVNITGFMVTRSGPSLEGWGDSGIELRNSRNCYIADNIILVNFLGILLESSMDNTIVNNNVSNNKDSGIFVQGSSGNTIANNIVMWNKWAGIVLYYSSDNDVFNNTASYNQDGIHVFSSKDNLITYNTVSNNQNGIHLFQSENNLIINNTVYSNEWAGILLYYYSNISIIDANTVSNNRFGILLDSSDSATIINNAISSNRQAAILILSSNNITIVENMMAHNGISILGYSLDYWTTHTIETSNTVNGKPVYYWKNVTGGMVPSDAGQVILANCTGVIVENQDVSNGSVGIALAFSSGNTIVDNKVFSNDWYGIYLFSSDMNIIANNTFSEGAGFGTFIFVSTSNSIAGNTFSNNFIGICINYSANNTMEDNMLLDNDYGIYFHFSNNNTILSNTLSTNRKRGVSLFFSDINRIYHNSFVDNTIQAMDNTGTNEYDDGYPSGGNFWSDYTGVDQFSGPNQDQPGSDGIGDTPYLMTLGRRDRYPLMSPLMIVPPRPPTMLDAILSGKNLENITLTWALSPDDGSGLKSVVGYEIYRKMTYDSAGLGYELLAMLSNGIYTYVDDSTGQGDPNNYFYRVCAVDSNNNSACAKHQAGKFTRPLTQGPNLISVPLVQSNESIEKVLQAVKFDKVWAYDSLSREWKWYMSFKPYKGDLKTIDHTMGIWVNVTSECNLTVAGTVPTNTSIFLSAGWNLVGFPSFLSSFTIVDLKAAVVVERVEAFDASVPPHFLRALQDADILQAGSAYWVMVAEDIFWSLSND